MRRNEVSGMTQDRSVPLEHSGVLWRGAAGPPASDAQIREIEQALHVVLPASLLALVRLADGLQPEHDSIVQGGEAIDALTQILRFSDGQILNCRDAMLEDAENADRDPEALRWVIPIADNGDGWICLDYRADPGRVAYRVIAYSLSRVSNADQDGLYAIADSFDALLGMLKPMR